MNFTPKTCINKSRDLTSKNTIYFIFSEFENDKTCSIRTCFNRDKLINLLIESLLSKNKSIILQNDYTNIVINRSSGRIILKKLTGKRILPIEDRIIYLTKQKNGIYKL